MRNLFILFMLFLFVGCKNNTTKKNCTSTHEQIIPISANREEIRVINDCNGGVEYSQEVIRISKDSVISDGAYREYYKNGKLKILSYYKENILDSITIKYRENGTIEFKNYFKKGQRVGMQQIFFPNGNLQEANYHKNNTAIIFRVKYKEDGLVDSIKGQLFRIDLNKDINDYKLGDELHIINEMIVLDNITTKIWVKFKSVKTNKVYLRAEYSDFFHLNNSYYKGLFFSLEKKGVLNYFAKVSLYDEKTGLILKTDSNSFDINVR